jgi:hypothetical protein
MGANGMFHLRLSPGSSVLRVLISNGMGWEHVSVSALGRCPSWYEMECIKRLFWDAEDAVMQIHPPEREYVDCRPYTLHLWRPGNGKFPRPPSWMVEPKS